MPSSRRRPPPRASASSFASTTSPSLLVVGEVRRPHGLEGEVAVEIVTDFPERFRPGLRLVWRRGADERALTLRAAREHGRRLLLSFAGVDDVDAARMLQGGELCVPMEQAHPAPAGFYYSHELAGFVCEDAAGRRLGTARDLGRTAAGPMLTVEAADGREALVPWTHPIVVRVDVPERRIVLDPPEGLFEL